MTGALTSEEAIEREEIAEKLASFYMAGMTPTQEDTQRAKALGLDPKRIQEAVDACYEPEEDNL